MQYVPWHDYECTHRSTSSSWHHGDHWGWVRAFEAACRAWLGSVASGMLFVEMVVGTIPERTSLHHRSLCASAMGFEIIPIGADSCTIQCYKNQRALIGGCGYATYIFLHLPSNNSYSYDCILAQGEPRAPEPDKVPTCAIIHWAKAISYSSLLCCYDGRPCKIPLRAYEIKWTELKDSW